MATIVNKYIEILSAQRPYPYMVDVNNRQLFTCNFNGIGQLPMTDILGSLQHKLVTISGIVSSNNIFISGLSEIPTGDGPFIHLISTGGMSPVETHNSKHDSFSFQVITRGKNYSATESLAINSWLALDGIRGLTITHTI